MAGVPLRAMVVAGVSSISTLMLWEKVQPRSACQDELITTQREADNLGSQLDDCLDQVSASSSSVAQPDVAADLGIDVVFPIFQLRQDIESYIVAAGLAIFSSRSFSDWAGAAQGVAQHIADIAMKLLNGPAEPWAMVVADAQAFPSAFFREYPQHRRLLRSFEEHASRLQWPAFVGNLVLAGLLVAAAVAMLLSRALWCLRCGRRRALAGAASVAADATAEAPAPQAATPP
eukprot:CAMPEP_0176085472 /NCGR_PEP_ID=MMETSP0120_2-20121206/42777_1 /TAXON_ID=160619 /ORGANISM="Kryptoperidinium foliaceum, Strain CCMP 1326" /LENGTH=231 /DNA_ID=CAMNT_0017419287 /DNA_START=72 /DNA_END=765 /DNA_ORIENTATION=+